MGGLDGQWKYPASPAAIVQHTQSPSVHITMFSRLVTHPHARYHESTGQHRSILSTQQINGTGIFEGESESGGSGSVRRWGWGRIP